MKDILKVGALYFTAAASLMIGFGAGTKVCDKLLNSKSNTKKAEEESK